jgi:hypothetical protein
VYSHFVEDPPIDLEVIDLSFFRWFYHIRPVALPLSQPPPAQALAPALLIVAAA